MIKKELLIIEALYFRYFIVFIFDNKANHLIYTKDILYIPKVNKKPSGK